MGSAKRLVLSAVLAQCLGSGLLAHASIVDSLNFVFAFGASHTTNGWNGAGDPTIAHAQSCSSAGPNWVQQLVGLQPSGQTQLIDLAVSGASANSSIVPNSALDFIRQVTAFDTYVRRNTKIAWNSTNALVAINFGTNDVKNVYKLNTTDQPNGTLVHKRDLDSYFNSVNRLYDMGIRAFAFTGIMPFHRAQTGISQGPTLQAQLGRHIADWESQIATRSEEFCKSKVDLKACIFYDLLALGNELMDNFKKYGFATPDGVCSSYASRSACTVNATADPACLGTVDKYIWKDDLHMTWKTHLFWAQGVHDALAKQ